MKKLEYIICKNFKGFYGTTEDIKSNKIVLGGKNLLVYGENGSGKSSLYWALYTFLMSALRKDYDVLNYFRSDYNDNWRNIYAQDNEEASIQVKFEDKDEIEISNTKVYTEDDDTEEGKQYKKETREFVENTILLSDFINYKFIFKTFDFQTYQSVDLFPLFEKELFYYMNFERFFSNTAYASLKYAHNYLEHIKKRLNGWKSIPQSKKKNDSIEDIINEYFTFCDALRYSINNLIEPTNRYLHDFFHCDHSISFQIGGCDLHHDGRIWYPNIFLYVLLDGSSEIRSFDKAHLILNEAKLTTIALAIRFAMMDAKATSEDYGRLLILDDLLISLDMSNRDVVLDILLDKANQYQIIMMTHDRAFYNIIKKRIENHRATKDWVCKEMYKYVSKNIPKPKIINTKKYLDLAYKYLKACDFPASANYMRKECERILGEILPKDKVFKFPEIPDLQGQIETVDAGGEKVYQLQNLIDNFIGFCLETGINVSEYQKILEFKDMLLNPLSHNDFQKPIYRGELEKCYEILLKLNMLNAHIEKKIMGDNGDKFNLRFSDGTKDYVYTFHLKNAFHKYKLNGQNIWRNEPFGSMSWEEDNKVQYIGENLADPANPVIPCYDLKDFINFLMKTHFPKHKHISITNMSNGWTNIWDVAYIINDDGSETLLKDL